MKEEGTWECVLSQLVTGGPAAAGSGFDLAIAMGSITRGAGEANRPDSGSPSLPD